MNKMEYLSDNGFMTKTVKDIINEGKDLEFIFKDKFEIMMSLNISNSDIDNMSYYDFNNMCEVLKKSKIIVSN